jgi:hypothetical protein
MGLLYLERRMERPCYRCGASIDEQTTFCPACGAPQIRVSAQRDDAELPRTSPIPLSHDHPFPPDHTHGQAVLPVEDGPFSLTEVRWKKFLRIALPFALTNGLVTLPLGMLGWLLIVPASVLWSIFIYRRQVPGAALTPGRGARMGATLGLLSAGFFSMVLVTVAALKPAEFRALMLQALQQAAAQNPDPQVQQMLQSWFQGPNGMAVFVAIFAITALVIFLVCTSTAGALAGLFSANRADR